MTQKIKGKQEIQCQLTNLQVCTESENPQFCLTVLILKLGLVLKSSWAGLLASSSALRGLNEFQFFLVYLNLYSPWKHSYNFF